ncbi:MAG TPA: SpvB/TcaC N-terminal domain-containing protein, partial [Polyangiaceae bacterium]|nr:SpvB/TcaC N-terminal domain-containing protein [Polyangiaceae bacterium]
MRLLAIVLLAPLLLLPRDARASSALEPTHISLPSGPGSIEGLGRNFAPSLASGTASYGVDIAVPPSAGGFAPHVSLDYDSAGGVTEVGMGWRIAGIPSVRRRSENGLPR